MEHAPSFYDWEKTLSFDADVTMVIGARGIGKTFGLRLQCIQDYIKRGHRFVEIVRYKNELSDVADGYFDRIEKMPQFENYMFKTDTNKMYIANRPENGKKPVWEKLGYFVALTNEQKKKKKTHDNVRRLIFDECILDKHDRYHTYLSNEWVKLSRIIDTYSRQRADVDGIKPRLYMLGNALDITNPFFAIHKVKLPLEFGYRWYSNKTFLLHYVESEEYSNEKIKNTVAGRMLALVGNTSDTKNEFAVPKNDFIKRKPKSAKFQYGIMYNSHRFGIWIDVKGGYYYISDKIPNNSNDVYYLQSEDASVNWMAATRITPALKVITEGYYLGLLRYTSLEVQINFMEILGLYGVN